MAYKFVEKRKTTQEEMVYIVYMILGSYFHKVECRNRTMVDRLYLYYMELKDSAQEKKEKRIIGQAEKILKGYKRILSAMNCEVMIRFEEDKCVLDFLTGFEAIHAEVDQNGICEMEISHDSKQCAGGVTKQ